MPSSELDNLNTKLADLEKRAKDVRTGLHSSAVNTKNARSPLPQPQERKWLKETEAEIELLKKQIKEAEAAPKHP